MAYKNKFGVKESIGAHLLREWLAVNRWSHNMISRKLGWSKGALQGALSGQHIPRPDLREALEQFCGIPPEAWNIPAVAGDRSIGKGVWRKNLDELCKQAHAEGYQAVLWSPAEGLTFIRRDVP